MATETVSNRSSIPGGDTVEMDDVEKFPRDKLSSGAILKAALVCAATFLACGSYLASFVYVAITPLVVTTAGTVSVGIAGGVCLLTAPTVLHKEFRLSMLPSKIRYTYARITHLPSHALLYMHSDQAESQRITRKRQIFQERSRISERGAVRTRVGG